MAWLLHEPRLVAKVPVFCIIGVRPLLKNSSAPATVSIGAVHLLLHLHSRLEVMSISNCKLVLSKRRRIQQVLIGKDGGGGGPPDEDLTDGDVTLLWEVLRCCCDYLPVFHCLLLSFRVAGCLF